MDMGSKKEKIILLRKECKSFNQIREITNCSKGYISSVCSECGLSDIGLNKNKKLTDNEKEELKEYYKTHTKEETAYKFGVSVSTVKKYSDRKQRILTDYERIHRNYNHVKLFRTRIKERAVEYKGGECIVCGYRRCIKAFEFHHLNPEEKDFTISKNCNKSWDKVRIELDKCVLLCANCHREVHDNMITL